MRRRRFTWMSCLSSLITLAVLAGAFFVARPFIVSAWLKSSLYVIQTHLDDYRRVNGYYPDTIAELEEEEHYKLPYDPIGLLYFTGIRRTPVAKLGEFKPGAVVYDSYVKHTSKVDAYYLGIYGLDPDGGLDYFKGEPYWDNVYEEDDKRDGEKEGLILVLTEPPLTVFERR